MVKIWFSTIIYLSVFCLTACHTVECIGEDMETAGELLTVFPGSETVGEELEVAGEIMSKIAVAEEPRNAHKGGLLKKSGSKSASAL